ncbi:minor capsid protein [Mycobacteroides abscessus]|uniref:minor capsid protein n=1 Tax=unclassified Desemzia TaxID=2685243 RepID=UPI0009A7BDB0|nr:NAD+--asparagine ADP-ribosyltransferase [Mycobacteroides abscessus subsp. abscessus]
MKSNKYWKNRFEALEQMEHDEAIDLYQNLENKFNKTQKDLAKSIEQWYQRVAVNNEISMADARKFISAAELEELQWDVEDYIRYGEENEDNPIWMKQLENASARVHISNLDLAKLQIQNHVEVLFAEYLAGVTSLSKKVIPDTYYHSVFEVQKGFNVGWKVQSFDKRRLDKIINKPWSVDKKIFSDRIWENKDKLVNELHKELTQMTIRGGKPDEAIKNIAKKMNTSKKQAGRLIMTESAYFYAESQKEAYQDLDVEKYQIVATLDSLTSEICQDMDLEVFEMSNYEVGVTAPPFHPNCRTVTIPYFEDDFIIGSRAARDDETGKTYYVPANMKYEDWYAEYIEPNIDERKYNEYVNKMKTKYKVKSFDTLLDKLSDKDYEKLGVIDVSNNVIEQVPKKRKK